MGLEAPDLDEKEARMTFEAKVRDYKKKIRKELKRERADIEHRLREKKAEQARSGNLSINAP